MVCLARFQRTAAGRSGAAAAGDAALPSQLFFQSHGPAIELAERILDLLPDTMSKVFFNNSGSEANDTAIKLVWYYNNALGRPRKKKIVSRIKAITASPSPAPA